MDDARPECFGTLVSPGADQTCQACQFYTACYYEFELTMEENDDG